MYISVNFLKNLILTFPRDSVMEGRNYNNRNQEQGTDSREKILFQLIEQNIFSKIIMNCSNYMRLAKQGAENFNSQGVL